MYRGKNGVGNANNGGKQSKQVKKSMHIFTSNEDEKALRLKEVSGTLSLI